MHTYAATGKNYYRLLQVDFDDAFEYSDVRVVDVVGEVQIEIYPTLVSNFLQVVISENINTEVIYQIVNVAGAQLLSGVAQQEIDLTNLDKGMYFIQFDVNGEFVNHRFIKR